MQVVIYLIGNVFLAATLGHMATKVLTSYEMPTLSKFLIGFSLHPYFIGIYMMVIPIASNKMGNGICVGIPYLMAIGYWAFVMKKFEWAKIRKTYYCPKNMEDLVAIILATSVSSGIIGSKTISTYGAIAIIITAMIFVIIITHILNRYETKNVRGIKSIMNAEFVLAILLLARIRYTEIEVSDALKFSLIIAVLLIFIFFDLVLIKISEKHKMRISARLCSIYTLLVSSIFLFIFARTNYTHLLPSTTALITVFGLICIILMLGGLEDMKIIVNSELLVFFMIASMISATFTFIVLSGTCAVNGSDAIQYLSEAYDYATNMRFGGLNDYHGNLSGSLLANIHSPVWPGYLSNGLMYSNTSIGYPIDYGARMGFAMSYICMIAGILSIGASFGSKLLGPLAVSVFFANYKSINCIYGSTREGFRIIPLLVFFQLLAFAPIKNHIKSIIPLIVISAFVTIGHPINAIEAMIIAVGYIVWIVFKRDFLIKELFISVVGMLIGGALGGGQIIKAFLETGSLTGGLIDFNNVLANTSYYDTYMSSFLESSGNNYSYFQLLSGIASHGAGIVLWPGVISTIVLLVLFVKTKNYGKEFFLGLICFLQVISITGLFRWSGRSYVEWCYRNYRYTIQMYVFFAFAIGILIERGILNNIFRRMLSWGIILYSALTICLVTYGLMAIGNREDRLERYTQALEVIDRVSPELLLLDNYNMNYYLYNRGVSFWTKPMEELRRANSDDEFYEEAKRKRISAILITEDYWNLYWKDTELDHFLQSTQYINEIIPIIEDGVHVCTVYYLK